MTMKDLLRGMVIYSGKKTRNANYMDLKSRNANYMDLKSFRQAPRPSPLSRVDASHGTDTKNLSQRGSMLVRTQEESLLCNYGEGESRTSNVSFASVMVHYHSTRVGDHLDCDRPPLALGEPTGDSEIYDDVDQYEQQRPYTPRHDPRLNPVQRLEVLQNEGYTVRAIIECLEVAEKEYFMVPEARTSKIFRGRSMGRVFGRQSRHRLICGA